MSYRYLPVHIFTYIENIYRIVIHWMDGWVFYSSFFFFFIILCSFFVASTMPKRRRMSYIIINLLKTNFKPWIWFYFLTECYVDVVLVVLYGIFCVSIFFFFIYLIQVKCLDNTLYGYVNASSRKKEKKVKLF